jgi:hypothetical protein
MARSLAHRDADLFVHDVETGRLFRDRMPDLDARVHDEGEDAARAEELDRADAGMAADNKKAALLRGRPFELVAGAGFEPTTFRL